MRADSLIEPLEDRIAPAAVTISANGKMAVYTDTLGDAVHVTTSKGTFTSAQFIFDPNTPGQLTELALTGSQGFNGANLVFSVIPVAGGSATVNVGYIDAQNLSLGSVTLPGDLGRIDVGGGPSSKALGTLNVASLGVQGAATQGGLSVSTVSNITGTLGTVNVSGNVDGTVTAQDYRSRPGTGKIGHLNIGGSLDGNTSSGSGQIFFSGSLGTAVISGGIEGGSADFSGTIAGYGTSPGTFETFSKIGSVTVKGSVPDDPNPNPSPIPSLPGTSILGGSGGLSGGIVAVDVGTVTVAGDIHGGTGIASGGIQGAGKLGTVVVDGSLIGGNFNPANISNAPASNAGLIAGGSIRSVTIGKDIDGGSGLNSGEVVSMGTIQKVTVMGDLSGGSAGTASDNGFAGLISAQALGKVVIDGSLIGGNLVSGDSNQTGSDDGAILSNTSIGSIYIGKNLSGGSGPSSGIIMTEGGAIGTLTIGGADATDGSVVGGSGASSGTISVQGAVGRLTLTQDLTGGSGAGSGDLEIDGAVSSLTIAGSVTGGTANNTGTIAVVGLLKSATIKGGLTGSSSGATMLSDTGYVQAGEIGAMAVGGALTSGTAGSGGLGTSGAIRSLSSIGSLSIGSLVGNSTNPAIISAVGRANLPANAKTDVAIQNLTVNGNASYADILAGYNADTQNGARPLGTGVSADAQIGTVRIDGNLTATNIVAGVGPGATGFGAADSTALGGAGVTDLPSIISRISKVIIAGSVEPPASSTDSYGIAAQYVLSATVTGVAVPLVPGPDNDTFAASKEHLLGGVNGDEVLYEV